MPAQSIVAGTGLAADKDEATAGELGPQAFVIEDRVRGRKVFNWFREAWRAVRSL